MFAKDYSLAHFREDIVRDLNNCSSNQSEFRCSCGQGWVGYEWGPVGDKLRQKWGLFSLPLTYISTPTWTYQKKQSEMAKIYIDCYLFHSVVELRSIVILPKNILWRCRVVSFAAVFGALRDIPKKRWGDKVQGCLFLLIYCFHSTLRYTNPHPINGIFWGL